MKKHVLMLVLFLQVFLYLEAQQQKIPKLVVGIVLDQRRFLNKISIVSNILS